MSEITLLTTDLSDRRLSAKLVPTFVDRLCRVVNAADPYGRIICFLDRSVSSVGVKTLKEMDLNVISLFVIAEYYVRRKYTPLD
jgi:hypothetical protein